MAGNVFAQNGSFYGTIKTAPSGTRVEMSSNFADINLYHDSLNVLKIYDAVDSAAIWSPASGLRLGNSSVGTVYAVGAWNFSSASISGLSVPAKFS
ncbi:hypothetical protein D3C75_855790 [compost metagenome]